MHDLLALSPEMQKQMRQAVTPKGKERTKEISITDHDVSSTISLTTKVKIEDEWYSAIVDTGAAVSAISQTLMKKIGFTIQAPVTYKIKGVGGQRIIPLGVIHDFHVKIGKITIPIEVAVLDIPSCQLILGNDFLKKVNAQILYADPSPTLTITWLGR